MQGVTLFFGGNVGGQDWEKFARGIVTPAFPDGFTVVAARGQWRDPGPGVVEREDTRVLIAFGMGALARAAPVVAAYRAQFHQQSVGIVSQDACGAF